MNPATRALMQQIEDEDLAAFVDAWDALEELAVQVYRGGEASPQKGREFVEIQSTLRRRYPQWQPHLEAHWRATKINNEPLDRDPFLELIDLPAASAIVGNWTAMQTLPAAREALNGMLMERIEGGNS